MQPFETTLKQKNQNSNKNMSLKVQNLEKDNGI